MVSLHGLTRWESIGKAENTTLFDAFLLVTTQQLIKNSWRLRDVWGEKVRFAWCDWAGDKSRRAHQRLLSGAQTAESVAAVDGQNHPRWCRSSSFLPWSYVNILDTCCIDLDSRGWHEKVSFGRLVASEWNFWWLLQQLQIVRFSETEQWKIATLAVRYLIIPHHAPLPNLHGWNLQIILASTLQGQCHVQVVSSCLVFPRAWSRSSPICGPSSRRMRCKVLEPGDTRRQLKPTEFLTEMLKQVAPRDLRCQRKSPVPQCLQHLSVGLCLRDVKCCRVSWDNAR